MSPSATDIQIPILEDSGEQILRIPAAFRTLQRFAGATKTKLRISFEPTTKASRKASTKAL